MKPSDKHDIGGLLALALLAAVLAPKTEAKPNERRDTEIMDGLLGGLLGKVKAAEESTPASKAEKTINNMIDDMLSGRMPKAEPSGPIAKAKAMDKPETPEEKRLEALLAERGLFAGNAVVPSPGLVDGSESQVVGIISFDSEGYKAMMDAQLMKKMPAGDFEVRLVRIEKISPAPQSA